MEKRRDQKNENEAIEKLKKLLWEFVHSIETVDTNDTGDIQIGFTHSTMPNDRYEEMKALLEKAGHRIPNDTVSAMRYLRILETKPNA